MIKFCDRHRAIIPEGDETCLSCQRKGIMTQPNGHSLVGWKCEWCGVDYDAMLADPVCPETKAAR